MKILLITILITLLSSCSSKSSTQFNQKVDSILNQKTSAILFSKEASPMLIDVSSPRDEKLEQKVNILINSPTNIITAIDFADKELSISADSDVDLNKKFIIKFSNQTLGSYLKHLSNITGYYFDLRDGIVYIHSKQTKSWDLQVLSLKNIEINDSAKNKVKSDGSAPIVAKKINDSWQKIVRDVESIMSPSVKNNSIVLANEQLGIITATGLPQKIKQVDEFLSNLINSSNRQVHLQVQVLDVLVDESVGQGINWNLISKQNSGFQIGNDSKTTIDGAGLISIGTPANGLIDFGKKITLDIMLNLLRKQGKVRVNNQPNITITNGREAYITTGDEFSYVAKINATPDDSGNVVTTSEIERMSVGVDMRVTPKILPDNRIVVSVVPIVSSLKSFTSLTSGSGASIQEFKTPNIALQKLSTQVIVESGKTIHLGGLIASKISSAVKGLPGDGFLSSLFKGVQKSIERREIVILITPTIVK